MCSLRGFWVLSPQGAVLFSRRFPTVEKKVAQLEKEDYVKVPDDKTLSKLFLAKITNPTQDENVYWILALQDKKDLWPVIYLKTDNLFLVAIPAVDNVVREPYSLLGSVPVRELPLVNLPFITSTVVLLQDLLPLVESLGPNYSPKILVNLQSPLSRILPFGKPSDTDLRNIVQYMYLPFPTSSSAPGTISEEPGKKLPAWRPVPHKGKQVIEFKITETINAIQYDKAEKTSDTCHIQGVVDCKSFLESGTEVSAIISPVEIPGKIFQINPHSCVQNTDAEISKKLLFSPPVGQFVLFRFDVDNVDKLPIRGFYQMKEISPTEVKVLLQLKLQEYVKNEFVYCRVVLPFFNRGKISGVLPGNTAGEVTVSKDRKSIEWDIGTKFTAKNLEVALPASIYFGKRDFSAETKREEEGEGEEKREIVGRINADEENSILDDDGTLDDPFCTGANCYVKVDFKILNFGHIEIPSKNMSLIPKGKTQANFLSERIFQSKDYIIWNSWGDVNYAAKFPQL